MTNQEVAALFDEVYNNFWLKWRDRKISEGDWDAVRQEAKQIADRYPGKLSIRILVEMQMELEERQKGDETNGK